MDSWRAPAGPALDLSGGDGPARSGGSRAGAGPRGLILDLFGEYLRFGTADVALSELTCLMGDFGVGPPTVRMTLTRLRRDGWFTSERCGRETRYRLSAAMQRVLEEGRNRIFEAPPPTSSGLWTMVIYQLSEAARVEREQLRKRLAFQGFGALGTSTWLAAGDRRALAREVTADLSRDQVETLCCTSDGPGHDRALARRCWDLEALGREYDAFLAHIAPLAAEADRLDGRQALVVRTRLVAAYRRYPAKDPLLPRDLCPQPWPGTAAHELFRDLHTRLGVAARRYVSEVVGQQVQDTSTSPPG